MFSLFALKPQIRDNNAVLMEQRSYDEYLNSDNKESFDGENDRENSENLTWQENNYFNKNGIEFDEKRKKMEDTKKIKQVKLSEQKNIVFKILEKVFEKSDFIEISQLFGEIAMFFSEDVYQIKTQSIFLALLHLANESLIQILNENEKVIISKVKSNR